MKVLVTRPRIFAEPLCAKIAALGATPILFPTIEFCSTPNTALLNQQLQTLNRCDMAIFTSRAAVLYGMQAIEELPLFNREILQNRRYFNFAAIGPGTANELSRFGVSAIVCPKEPPYESEALLGLPEFQNMEGKEIMIFRGNDGRMLLYETLRKRGAKVSLCEVYQRRLPELGKELPTAGKMLPTSGKTLLTSGKILSTSAKTSLTSRKVLTTLGIIDIPDVIIVTSPKCLMNLITLVGEELWGDLQQCYFIVVGWRTYNLSATLGIRHQFLAEGADDSNILQALAHLRI